MPFTDERQAHQLGLIVQLLHNQNIDSKNRSKAKSASEIFPYLKNQIPDHLEDERVLKAKNLLSSVGSTNVNKIVEAMKEEIEIEKEKAIPDRYVISRLTALVNQSEG